MTPLREHARILPRIALACALLWVARPPPRLLADDEAAVPPVSRDATGEVGPVRLRAALSRGVYVPGSADRLYIRIDLTANAPKRATSSSPDPVPAPAVAPVAAGQGHAHGHGDKPDEPVAMPPAAPNAVSAPAQQRPPLSLALLIDRSGSMAEDRKFAYAMAAANLVIENLSDRDLVTVVAFSDAPTVLSPLGLVVNRAFLRHRLTEIEPQGWTNLSGGLLEAFAQLDARVPDAPAEGRVRRVIVLTDGEANRGIIDPNRLREIVAAAKSRGIGVSTLGCGVKYDESVLRMLATTGGGRYSYVSDPEQIPVAMAAELEGLLAVAAQNAKLKVRVLGTPGREDAASGVIARVLGREPGAPTRETAIELGDLRDRESGVFVLELTPPRSPTAHALEIEAELTFDRPDTASRERVVARVRADRPGSTALAADAAADNPSVSLYAAVLDAVERAEEAAKGLDEAESSRVEQDLAALYPRARSAAIERRDQELLNVAFLLKHFGEEMRAARAAGLTHEHEDARARFQKDADYRRYLLEHHRGSDR